MDLDLKRYEELYDMRLRTLTFDWKERRKKIVLPDTIDTRRPGYCTQEYFANMVGLSANGYRILEQGGSRPKKETFCRVMALFEDFGV